MASAEKPGESTPKATATGAVDPSAGSEKLDEGMAAVRSLLQRTGAGLAAAATAIFAGLGWAELHEVFPVPANVGLASKVVLVAAVVAAVGGAAWLAAIFLYAQRRVLMTTDPDDWTGLNDEDKAKAENVLKQHGREEGSKNLEGVELRALRLDRVARRLSSETDPSASEVQREADRLFAFVSIALHRAAATVLENRSRRAFGSFWTAVALAAAAGGTVTMFAIADYYEGQRELSTLVTSCVKAEAEGVVGACEPFERADSVSLRTIRKQADLAAEVLGEAQATPPDKLDQKQERLLERFALCQAKVDELPALKDLPLAVRAEAARLCAAGSGE